LSSQFTIAFLGARKKAELLIPTLDLQGLVELRLRIGGQVRASTKYCRNEFPDSGE
jgi:hypothetical protein